MATALPLPNDPPPTVDAYEVEDAEETDAVMPEGFEHPGADAP